MGEAKRRGTPEERAQQARARVDALRPAQLVCGACKTSFTNFDAIPAPGLHGIDAVFGGQCPNCGNDVVVFKGESKAVAEAMLAYERMMGVPVGGRPPCAVRRGCAPGVGRFRRIYEAL